MSFIACTWYKVRVATHEPRKAAKLAFGRAIERLRKPRFPRQEDFGKAVADRLGGHSKWRTQKVISHLENGNTPVAIEDIVTFASVLEIPAGDLLIAWAEELGPEDVAGGLLLRARTLAALDELTAVVRQATADFLLSSLHSPGEVQEMTAVAAELLVMPKPQRRVLFGLVGALTRGT